MATHPRENLVAWLRDAYAMEAQAVELLERQIDRLEHYPEARARLQLHLDETRRQQKALDRAFDALGTSPSGLKEAVMKLTAEVQGMMHALAGDEVMKHALGSYAFEHFEAASYRILASAAEQAGEPEVARICADIQHEEEAMARWLWDHLPQLTETYIARAATGGAAKR